MEELDGEPTVTVRAPQRVWFALAAQGLSLLHHCRLVYPPASREAPVPFSQLSCHHPEVTLISCPCLDRSGRRVSAASYAQNTWPQRPHSVPLPPSALRLPIPLAFLVGLML